MRSWLFASLAQELLHRYRCFPMRVSQCCLVFPGASDANGCLSMCVFVRYQLYLLLRRAMWLVSAVLLHCEFVVPDGLDCVLAGDLLSGFIDWLLFSLVCRFLYVDLVLLNFQGGPVPYMCQFFVIVNQQSCLFGLIQVLLGDWNIGHLLVCWSIDFSRWVSKQCQCLFLYTSGGFAFYCCSAGGNFWGVYVGKCRCCVSWVDLVSWFFEFVVNFIGVQGWKVLITFFRVFLGFRVRVQFFLVHLDVNIFFVIYKGSKSHPMYALVFVCLYSVSDLNTFV